MIDTGYSRSFSFATTFVLIVVQLHLLRNITSAYYALYLISFITAFWSVLHRWKFLSRVEKKSIFYVLAIFFVPIGSLVPGVIAGKYENLEEITVGVSRIIFSLPMYLVILSSPSDKKSINRLLATVALITLIAALSVPYQFLFGAVSWFAEGSERAGIDRFASLFGSLTALGGVVGYGVLAAILSIGSNFLGAFVVSGIVLGALLSLQKAAIANIVLCFLFLPFIKKFSKKSIFVSLICFMGLFGLAGAFFWNEIGSFLDTVRISSDSDFSGDFSFTESILQRLVELPMIAIDFHGVWSLLLGMGPIGGSGAFGYVDIPMSHNGFVDLFLVGGIGYFLLFIWFLFFVFARSDRSIPRDDVKLVRFGAFCFFLLLINMLFSGLNFFTPSGAMFFAVSIKCLLLKNAARSLA